MHDLYTVIEIEREGGVKVLKGDSEIPDDLIMPTEPGIYQWRPVAKRWSSDAEHGHWHHVFGWGRGVLEPSQFPRLDELPADVW